MIILIAESKTMTACDRAIDAGCYSAHTPLFEADADAAMARLRGMTAGELSEAAGLSVSLAAKLSGMVYEFPNKALGSQAIEAFTGVVFKAFDYASLDGGEREAACRDIRIVSSLYGWLRPDDIIKPYRFDFGKAPTADGQAFATYWRGKLTDSLLADIEAGAHTEVLNLMPGDAARCFDWSRIGQRAAVLRADFREIMPGGTMRTPNSGMLKTLRGTLLRQIVLRGITQAGQLRTLTTDTFIASEELHTPEALVFLTAKG
ncbi:MAG: YaaA family protein [Muribaculaceae bacterium]|nr:YaaA family protein [Muribaculaceae bacterium]